MIWSELELGQGMETSRTNRQSLLELEPPLFVLVQDEDFAPISLDDWQTVDESSVLNGTVYDVNIIDATMTIYEIVLVKKIRNRNWLPMFLVPTGTGKIQVEFVLSPVRKLDFIEFKQLAINALRRGSFKEPRTAALVKKCSTVEEIRALLS